MRDFNTRLAASETDNHWLLPIRPLELTIVGDAFQDGFPSVFSFKPGPAQVGAISKAQK